MSFTKVKGSITNIFVKLNLIVKQISTYFLASNTNQTTKNNFYENNRVKQAYEMKNSPNKLTYISQRH